MLDDVKFEWQENWREGTMDHLRRRDCETASNGIDAQENLE